MRIFRVAPVNPLLMSGEEREKAAGTFQRLISQLQRRRAHPGRRRGPSGESGRAGRRVLGARCRPALGRRRAASAAARDPLALSRWRLHAALEESLRLHADSQAAVEVNHYVVVPFLPRQHVARAALAYCAPREAADARRCERTLTAHRRAVREHLGRVDALRSELEAEGMATELLDGEQVVHLLWSCFNPTQADRGRRPAQRGRGARRARRAGRAGGGDPGRVCGCGRRSPVEP